MLKANIELDVVSNRTFHYSFEISNQYLHLYLNHYFVESDLPF
jgi:hypothetical protein